MQRVCRHVAEGCPGCKLIASPYKTQLAAKTEAVRRVLAPFTSAPVTPIVPSPQQWGYRERGTFVQEGPRVGLRDAPEAPWRFWLTGSPSVSVYRPAARRARSATR